MSVSLKSQLELAVGPYKQRIDDRLDTYTQFDDLCPEGLRDAIRYCLLAPGKRLRPVLVLAAAEACGGEVDSALPAACAVEMIHTYSLVHDDLPAMDDDDLRRGRPTCHIQFDEATAILVGDALQPLAFEVLARDTHPPELAARCCGLLAQAAGARLLVGGQFDDLSAEKMVGDLELLEKIHRRKTGAMLLVSLELGGLLGGASAEQLSSLRSFGEKLGLAFQITDDLLDWTGTSEQMGKRVGKDADRRKLTFPGLLGVEKSRQTATTLVEDACALLAPLGPQRQTLELIARFVLDRNQ